jgi:hypothetical protein
MGKLNENIAREAAATGIKRAVETGTLLGESAIRLGSIFERVETIELSRYYWMRSWINLLPHRNIKVRHGDSAKMLRPSSEPTLYWLDGHWSAGKTAGEDQQCPLLDELRATSPGTYGDWYLIDDARLFTGPPARVLDPAQWPTIDEIRALVEQLRSGYEIEVLDDLDLIVVRPNGAAA